MAKKFEIRNSTAEFLIFTVADKEQGVEVLYKDESIWATQKVIATLFDVDRTVVTKHLKNISTLVNWIRKWYVQKLHIPPSMGL